jgi:hypothetical protein
MEMITSNMWGALRQLHNGLHFIDVRSGAALHRRGLAKAGAPYGFYLITDDGRALHLARERRLAREKETKRKAPTPDIAYIATCEGYSRDRAFTPTAENYRTLAQAAQRVATQLAERIVREKGL